MFYSLTFPLPRLGRARAPLTALAYDILSFPAMIDEEHRAMGDFNISSLDIRDLSRSFIKVKQLCLPYPACLKDEIAKLTLTLPRH